MISTNLDTGASVGVTSHLSSFGVGDGEEDTTTVEGWADQQAVDSAAVLVVDSADSAAAVEVLAVAEPVGDGSRYSILS